MPTDKVKGKNRLDAELEIACEVQAHLFPLQMPVVEGFDISALNRPCSELGGDYFDAFAVDGSIVVAIGDVVGKGIGPALLMSNLQAMLRALAKQCTDPATLLEKMNSELIGRIADSTFITCVCMILRPCDGRILYANAGHNTPLLRRHNGDVVPLETAGLPLGVLEKGIYEANSIGLEPGDTLLLYTDGITECTDSSGDLFGQGRLKSVLSQSGGDAAQDTQDAICSAVAAFQQDQPSTDDMTLVVLKRTPCAGKSDRLHASADSISFGKLDFELVASMDGTPQGAAMEMPFRILVMGDFSGCAGRGEAQPGRVLAERRPRLVDRENIEEIMDALGVEIRLPLAGMESPATPIRFSDLDDFTPDLLYERLGLFREIRDKRKKLADPEYFARTIAAGNGSETPAVSATAATASPDAPEGLVGLAAGNVLDAVLQETAGGGGQSESPRGPSEWESFLSRIVGPSLVADASQQQAEVLSAIDAATGDMMRAILQYPAFRDIESAWRGLYFLVSRLETGEDLSIFILDVTKDELAADLAATDDLRATATYRLLVGQTVETPGAEAWGVLAGLYTFDSSRDDVSLLGRMANVARAAGAPFIAAAGRNVPGCESLWAVSDSRESGISREPEGMQAWLALRQHPAAVYLGLAVPRFLLRLPYGVKTLPQDLFDFEEMGAVPDHDRYLWGNPALACACLLGQAYSEVGWNFSPGIIQDIDRLPLHVYREGGDSLVTPCTEAVITLAEAESIMAKGFMPFLAFKDRDRIRLARFQSLADPPKPLAGRWQG